MRPALLIGVPLLIAGITLIVLGVNASNSLADQLSNTFLGRFTEHTTHYIIGGIVLTIAGSVLALLGARSAFGKAA